MQDGAACHFVASFMAGFLATAASIPADMVKTRSVPVVHTLPLSALCVRVWWW
jgi:hypothetical protein